ncbi:MAG: ribosomal RNA small subunit methyltransferase A [Phycisphaerales bacterium]|nr:MAG: ribosomal RNA small subunit methyltransferase A [Phycisphaerales bacterium]
MQTKHQIRQLLCSAGIRPKKRLGQHFLIDLNLIRLLVDSAGIGADDVVLEAGCGTGSLTEALVERAGRVIAVELDAALAGIAGSRLLGAENLRLINGDVLERKSALSGVVTEAVEAARRQCGGRVLLVSNLPYGSACPLMLNLVEGPTIADGMYVTVQKQVAERMTAGPGGREYGALSIFLQATGRLKTIRTLKPGVFWPAPGVDSAMIAFEREQEKVGRIDDMEIFREVISLFMGHRRKMLASCTRLAGGRLAAIGGWEAIFGRCSIDPSLRPEGLGPEGYVGLANACRARLRRG